MSGMSQPIFQSTLQDLIKGIRANRKDPSSFISKEIADIKTELKCTDPFLKAEAVRKLTYLQMIGYNVSWAAFAIIEVMSQPRFGHKRIGYVAANQTFDESTEVILLTTNLFKKEFSGSLNSTQYEAGLAINCLANIATKDLARDCISDLVLLMNHSRPYIRKKAVLCMYKLYVKFPQGLRLTFEKLKDRLDDSESSVVSTAVNVICELANKNPRNYLAMAPKFFKLLTTSSNNWMLIKVVKLLGSLVSEEPRLARKLLEPLATIIQNTGAKSLQYECIYTVTEALPYSTREDGSEAKNAPAVIKLCSDYLRGFIEDADQNLKYLGLVELVKLMKSSPRSAVDHRDIVLQCLNDDDVTIRSKALELLAGIVSRKSLVDLVRHLMQHARLAEGAYRDEVISKILYMCRKEKYSLVSDFAWYTSVLLDLAVMPGSRHGAEVADQLIEVALRVDTVRPYAVEMMLSMLLDEELVLGHARTTVCEVLKAAAWVIGEYAGIISQISRDRSNSIDDDTNGGGDESAFWIEGVTGEDIRSSWRGRKVHLLVMEALLHPRTTNLPALVQKVYLQAALKVFVRASSDCDAQDLADIVSVIRRRISVFMQSQNVEVQERATTFRQILAELDILAINWEDSTEEISRETKDAAAVTALNSGGAEGLNDKEKELMDLLEFPLYTQSSVRAVDEYGAKQAITKSNILHTLTSEEFYAVHSKAQRRVPVPEELNLDRPLNSKALGKLLATEIPENLQLSALSLVQVYQPQHNAYSSGSRHLPGHGSEESSFAGGGSGSYGNRSQSTAQCDAESFADPSRSGAGDHSTVNSGYTTKVSDDVFMLSSQRKGDPEIIPLSKILGDTFEDIGSKGRGGGKSHRKRATRRRGGEVNVVEMIPAGAVSSDDEDKSGQNKKWSDKRSGKTGKNATRGNNGKHRNSQVDDDGDEVDLGGVDITTPLREDEVFHIPTHHVVANQQQKQQQDGTWRVVGDGTDLKEPKLKKKSKDKDRESGKEKHSKHGGKDKSKSNDRDNKHGDRKEKKHSKHSSSVPASVEASLLMIDDSSLSGAAANSDLRSNKSIAASGDANLLGLDAHYTPTTSSIPLSQQFQAVPSAGDRINAMFDNAEISRRSLQAITTPDEVIALEKSRSSKREKSSSKKSSGNFWLPAHSDSVLDVLYAVKSDSTGQELQLMWRIINHNADGGAVSVGIIIDSPLLISNPCNGSPVSLAKNVLPGSDEQSSMLLRLFNPIDELLNIPCQLSVTSESLLGAEVRNVRSEIVVTVCATFSSLKLSEDEFTRALGQANRNWASVTSQIRISCKPKAAFKAIAGFLRASIVESEHSKAASMAAKTIGGDSVFVLSKVLSGGSVVQLDIKCACSTKQASEHTALLITQSLAGLTL